MRSERQELRAVEGGLFRAIMGSFATGVTVVTAGEQDGVRGGLTASAVSSVSADPPLLLTCIARNKFTLDLIRRHRSFAVNILGAGDLEVAGRFASTCAKKFKGIETAPGILGTPLIRSSLGYAECELFNMVDAGDHSIVIGKLVSGSVPVDDPLLYFRGRLYSNVKLGLQ